MNIKQAKNEIKNTVTAYLAKDNSGYYKIPALRQRPILLIGPPGIGKTQIMEQIAQECHIGLVAYTITHHTRQSAIGLPFIVEEEYDGHKCSVTRYTMSEIIASIYDKIRDTGLNEGILFIDEINCVSETLAPTMLQFLQCKTFGNQAIPQGFIIVAAGNPPEYNKSVRDFDMVTLDRVRLINIEADYKVWKEYALSHNVNRAIISYLELKPNNFYRIETDVDGLMYVTARGWEDLSELMEVYKSLNIPITYDIIHEFLHHPDVSEDVAAYFDLYYKYEKDYGISEILLGRFKTDVFTRLFRASFDERLSVVNLILSALQNQFKSYQDTKYLTDIWFKFLQNYRKSLDSNENPSKCYDELLKNFEAQLNMEKKTVSYVTNQIKLKEQLNISRKQSRPDASLDKKDAFDCAKKDFDIAADKLAATESVTLSAIENAFDFMEQAFQSSQEMVVFVTELAVSSVSALFLSEHDCPRYRKYSDIMLTGNQHDEIIKEIEMG